jgi:hypothetical protein
LPRFCSLFMFLFLYPRLLSLCNWLLYVKFALKQITILLNWNFIIIITSFITICAIAGRGRRLEENLSRCLFLSHSSSYLRIVLTSNQFWSQKFLMHDISTLDDSYREKRYKSKVLKGSEWVLKVSTDQSLLNFARYLTYDRHKGCNTSMSFTEQCCSTRE